MLYPPGGTEERRPERLFYITCLYNKGHKTGAPACARRYALRTGRKHTLIPPVLYKITLCKHSLGQFYRRVFLLCAGQASRQALVLCCEPVRTGGMPVSLGCKKPDGKTAEAWPGWDHPNGCSFWITDFNSSNPVCLYFSVELGFLCPANACTTRRSFPVLSIFAITL